MASVMMHCKRIHTWYDSSDLEKWEHGMQGSGVQAWANTRLGTDWYRGLQGYKQLTNDQVNSGPKLGKTDFRGTKEIKEYM